MTDEQITALLLGVKAAQIVLVGQPVFRLSDTIKQALKQAESSVEVPSVVVFEAANTTLNDPALSTDIITGPSVMCLHLPSTEKNPDAVLGWACRCAPQLVVVEHTASELAELLLPDKRFFSFGFRRLGDNDQSDPKRAFYAYSLSDYKRPPDWLNARFWANPERFDL